MCFICVTLPGFRFFSVNSVANRFFQVEDFTS